VFILFACCFTAQSVYSIEKSASIFVLSPKESWKIHANLESEHLKRRKNLGEIGMYLYGHGVEFYLKAHSLRFHWIFWLRFGRSSNLESGISLVSIQWSMLWPAEGIRVSQRDCTSFFYLDIVNNVYNNQHTALRHVTPHSVGTNLQIQPTDAFFSIITCTMKMDKYFSTNFVNFYSKIFIDGHRCESGPE
jgi:hypothetical protein